MGSIRLDDDLVQYMSASFQWVATHWNKLSAENRGLNYYGVTFIVEQSEIIYMKKIVEKWKGLFELAPANFSIYTEYDVEEQRFAEKPMEKDSIINELNNLITLYEQ